MKNKALVVLFLLAVLRLTAGDYAFQREIGWKPVERLTDTEGQPFYRAAFRDAVYTREMPGLPVYAEVLQLPDDERVVSISLHNPVYDVAPDAFAAVTGIKELEEEVRVEYQAGFDRKRPVASFSLVPARINPYNQEIEILQSFDIVVVTEKIMPGATYKNSKEASVLAEGQWYKFAVTRTGVHRITYSDLQVMGIDPSQVDPRKIRIYGNGGGMLPESLNEFRHEDLIENSIWVSGENDGKFDSQDFILFYGEAPHTWKYQEFSQTFYHEQNVYSDSTYYFLNFDRGNGRRIAEIPSVSEPANVFITKFTDYAYHEQDLYNLSNIGRVWYGEVFDVTTSYQFDFSFPNIDLTSPVYFRAYVAAKSENATTFRFYNGDTDFMSAIISGIPSSGNSFARPYIGNSSFMPASPDLRIRVNYQKSQSSSVGWLNYFELNVVRNLVFSGNQMSFRDPSSAGPGSIAEYTLSGAGPGVQIWHVSDPTNVRLVGTSLSGNSLKFRLPSDTLCEFIAFNGNEYFPVVFSKKIENQNLHSLSLQDMIIITHPLFREEADRLADFHRIQDGMTVFVTEIGKVYNEFSSGAQDVTAIRNFMKHLYDNSPAGEEPRYLLLFGDASFDYKDRIENNSNFVPTWEEEESLVIVYSIASDDYYGFLDGPGDNLLDIGIGRLPVQTVEQARVAVDKIIHYATNSSVVMKDWRNVVCFVADDEDGNLHLRQAEEMAAYIDTTYGSYHIDKIFVDAFPQVSTPGGQRSPEVNRAINNRIDKGCLVVNYTGHGGEVGWGHERFLENSDINSWSNYDHMPIFITATCEFSRYDDPERTSAGEYTFLNPNGGAIAMFTTARATFGGSNFNLNTALFDYMFEEMNGEYYRFGDLIRLAKNKGGVDGNDKKFILLGDPALHLAYPRNEVFTTRINGEDVGTLPDTLQALKKITVEGEVIGKDGSAGQFNGTVYPIVYDKPSYVSTLATDPTSYQISFGIQNNILYKGKAQVIDGKFSFTFIVPKDIAYQYGFGKISYYASNEEQDAHGYYKNIMVGGFDQSASPDVTGPVVELFMNNRYFTSGGITDENPDMLAFVRDESGINTVGTGIGHDLVAILDGNSDKPIILNDFYESDIDSYSSGTIRYPFSDLEEGPHTLSLKVWDVFNNSADAYLEFLVVSSEGFKISDLLNYPNPFRTETTFAFSHNQSEGMLDVMLELFDLKGQRVKVFQSSLAPTGYRSEPFKWDGNSEDGSALSKGIYVYRLTVTDEFGRTDVQDARLVMVR